MMTSSRPYLIRAIYEWIADNEMTPFVVVNVLYPGVSVPNEHVQEGKITLNVSASAVRKLLISNEAIQFDARFSGVIRKIYAPIESLSAIYARENGQGMVFEEDGSAMPEGTAALPAVSSAKTPPAGGKKGKPNLTIVK